MNEMQEFGKVVVTGGAGTCGDRIVTELLQRYGCKQVVSLDNDEGKLFFQSERLKNYTGYSCSMVDIRDLSSLTRVFSGAQIIVHCAAYKNVPMCEMTPTSCVDVNITGTENVIEAAIASKVEKVLFTSSDKAVNPTNIMGASKLVGERLIVAANLMNTDTIFAATRFGNVVGSTGSVLPIFVNQLISGKPMTVTDPGMTRFMMSQREASRLVLDSVVKAGGGEIFITKMPVVSIGNFAKSVYQICLEKGLVTEEFVAEKHLIEIGPRDGEKDYEELMSYEERPRSKDAGEFFTILPKQQEMYRKVQGDSLYQQCSPPERVYNSHEEPSLDFRSTKLLIESILNDDKIELRK